MDMNAKKFFISLLLCCISLPVFSQGLINVNGGEVEAVIEFQTAYTLAQKERKSLQNKIIAAELAVGGLLEQLHTVEKKSVDYLSNVSSGIQNLQQLKSIGNLITNEIPKNTNAVFNAMNEKRANAFLELAGKRVRNITGDLWSLVTFVTPLVSQGTMEVYTPDGKTQKKVNLLNSYERYTILCKVLGHLEDVNYKLRNLAYNVQFMDMNDAWKNIDSYSYYKYINFKAITEDIVREWRK